MLVKRYYPPWFLDSAIAAVEAERIRASRDFDKETAGTTPRDLTSLYLRKSTGRLLKEYIFRPFAAFAREACKLGLGGIWSIDVIQRQCDDYLRQSASDACREKLPDVNLYGCWEPTLLDWIYREFGKESLFRDYEDLLLALADAPCNAAPAEQEPRNSSKDMLDDEAAPTDTGASPESTLPAETVPPLEEVATQGENPESVAARQRPGPQPKPAITEAVRGIFQRIVPPGVRPIEKVEELGDAMDEAKNPPIPIPPTWKNRSVPLRTWSHAAETEPDIALKAMKSRLNPRVAGPDRAN